MPALLAIFTKLASPFGSQVQPSPSPANDSLVLIDAANQRRQAGRSPTPFASNRSYEPSPSRFHGRIHPGRAELLRR